MLNSIIRLSLQNRALVIALSILLMGFGGYVATNMPVDVFPDLTAPTVTVITEAHGMAPVEVETLVSFPIEASMNGAANVRRVRSATAVGISVVWGDPALPHHGGPGLEGSWRHHQHDDSWGHGHRHRRTGR